MVSKYHSQIQFGWISQANINKYKQVVQIWGANSGNIHVDNLLKIRKYCMYRSSLGGGQAVYAQQIIEDGGEVIGIDTMSRYTRPAQPVISD